MDRDQQRQNRRNTVSGFSCTAGAELNPLQNPAGRTGAACDPIPAAPVPFTAVSPTPCPAPLPVALNLPDGLIVPSDATIAYCPSTAGYSVTGTTASAVATGAQNQTILFTAISNITENQLNYLYQVVPSTSAAMIAAALSGSTSSVIDLTHLNYNQAEELIESIQDAKFVVNTLAVEQARNLLICQAENNLQTASCTSSAYFGPSAGVPTGMMYAPSATSSTGSILVTFSLLSTTGDQAAFAALNIPSLTAAAAQANLLALAQAESSLRCVYGNTAIDAACCTSQAPNNNLGYTAACVPATGPTIPGIATAVGYFYVPANTVFSAVSKNEANSVARELSRNSLNCYFPSEGVTATCVGLGLSAPFADASTTAVYLEPGAVILYDTFASVTSANTQALLIAQASLNCFWSNTEQTAFCPESGTFTAINNQVYNLDASPTASIHYSSTVPANTVISYVSQTAANQQALDLASANLSCVYCNDPIAPTCSGGVNATIGAAGDLVCNVLAEVAQNTAISLGNILVTTSDGGLNCCYGNEGVTNSIKCETGAYYAPGATNAFTSADVFFLPANVITVCQSTTAPEPPPLLFSYNGLYATDVAQVGCCSDTYLCGGITGSLTALPTLWSYTSNLFDVVSAGATFYTNSSGTTPYNFPPGYSYVVSRSVTPRGYRAITGGTGYTLGLTACAGCGALTPYTFKGSTAVNYSSTAAAMQDMFCGGPTAQTITLYTNSESIFSSSVIPSYWYTDACGVTAFNPVTGTSSTGYYFAGYLDGATGYLLTFSASGASNAAFYTNNYNQTSCPLSRYAYSVYVGVTACNSSSGATTLYGNLPAPDLFTSSTTSTYFYTSQFNDSSYFIFADQYNRSGYINYVAPDTIVYARPIAFASSTAGPPISCSSLNKLTVQWSNASADDVCNFPNYYSASGDNGNFNTNIRTLWCDVENPFVDGATAKFYTQGVSLPEFLFKPGVSGPVYLSQFSPGDTFRSAYRQYTWGNPNSTLKSYTGTFKASPFMQSSSAWGTGQTALWLHTATSFYMTNANPGVARTKEILAAGIAGCQQASVYSDIKYAFTGATALNNTYKRLSQGPGIANDIYSDNLLFDGIGYQLSSSVSGVTSANSITLNDLTKVGAGFTGAIISLAGVAGLGLNPYPVYISAINQNSGSISLGGYFNNVSSGFTGQPLYVTGFKIEATDWTSSEFVCHGPHCNKIEVGHSLYSYKIGSTASIGFVTQVNGTTIKFSAAPGFNNFSANDYGTGASDGSGHVYIQGRQFARLWLDDDKTTPLFNSLGANDYNYVWRFDPYAASLSFSYTTAKNLVLGNTAGTTAEFIVAGVNYAALSGINIPRPYEVYGAVYWDSGNYLEDVQYYSCTGNYSTYTNTLPVNSVGYISSCCDLLVPSDTATYGDTPVSACDWNTSSYNGLQPASPGNPNGIAGYIDRVCNIAGTYPGCKYYDSVSHTVIDNNDVILFDSGGAGIFPYPVRYRIINGNLTSFFPCSVSYPWLEYSTWSRRYIGYYNSDPMYSEYPVDYGPGGTTIDSSIYFFNKNYNGGGGGTAYGYIFKDFDPVDSGTGCNCGNFLFKDYGLASGYRYSIWGSTTDAWQSTQAYFVNPSVFLQPPDYNTPYLTINECTTGCNPAYTCLNDADCDYGAVGALASPSNNLAFKNSIDFNPSLYDVPTPFNFGDMPSVGGTAEDLKAQATQIAQNIVNSFVRCFYFNDYQTGKVCDDPTFYLVQQGYANAGEVISNISKADANDRAKQLADSRTVCLNPNFVNPGASGCENTEISNDVGSSNLGAISLSFSKAGCSFTPTLSFSSSVSFQSVQLRQLTVCSSAGQNITMYVPDWGGDVVGGVSIAYKPSI